MPKLNPIEHKILVYMLKRKTFATTTQIANGSNISWNTANAYLKEFRKRGWVRAVQKGRTIYWKAKK